MKKQNLILTIFTLAIFAGMNAFGQMNTEEDYLTAAPTYCVPAVPLSCAAGDALHPAPGVAYDYTITSSTAGTIHWFVTDDPNVVTAQGTLTTVIDPGDASGNYLLSSDAVYNAPANTSATINLTWKSFDGNANQVLLVAYSLDAAGCTDNIEVYRIIPEYAFTLDIAGILDDGTEGATECVSPVQSAIYNGTDLTVDYGINYVYFTVNAANWQTSWETDLVASTDGASTLGAPEWQYPSLATTGGAWNANGTEVLASSYTGGESVNGFVDSDGACIIVRVPVDHDATENIVDETINLVVNGEMINPQTSAYDGIYPDLDEGATATDPCISDLTTDNYDYVITPRPDINEVAPSPFENKVPRD